MHVGGSLTQRRAGVVTSWHEMHLVAPATREHKAIDYPLSRPTCCGNVLPPTCPCHPLPDRASPSRQLTGNCGQLDTGCSCLVGPVGRTYAWRRSGAYGPASAG